MHVSMSRTSVDVVRTEFSVLALNKKSHSFIKFVINTVSTLHI